MIGERRNTSCEPKKVEIMLLYAPKKLIKNIAKNFIPP